MPCAASAELEQQVEQLQGEKRQLQADLFGRRSETTSLKDRSNHLDDPQDDTREPGRKRGQQAGNPGPKRRDYSPLPVREEFVELPPEQCVCPDCGQPLRLRSDTEDSEQIEIEVSCLSPRDSPATLSSGPAPARATAPSPLRLLPS